MVTVKYKDQRVNNLPLTIVRGTDKAAMWLEHIKLNWQKVCYLQGSVSGVLEKHIEVFGEGMCMEQQQRSFQRAKEHLKSVEVLAHYDPTKPILL